MKYRSSRIFACVLSCAVLVACAHILPARAAVSLGITEIMYDPLGTDANREWVEACNSGSSDIDMSGHYILTDGLSSAHHSLVAQQASSVIPAGACAVIVQDPAGFRGDYPGYAGLMFDSSWSGLTTTSGKTIVIIDSSSTVLDSVTYDPTLGGNNTGDSLQKNAAGTWIPAAPSPGVPTPDDAASVVVSSTSGDMTDSTTSGSTSSDSTAGTTGSGSTGSVGIAASSAAPAAPKPAPVPAMRVELSVPLHAVAGVALTISDKVYGTAGDLRPFGVGYFALGDGGAHDGPSLDSFTYIYRYPGTYVVAFEYRDNRYVSVPAVTARATVEVSAPSVSISSVMPDGSIELSNTGAREADISGWTLSSGGGKAFRVPSGTVILPNKKIVLGAAITGMVPASVGIASLMLPSGASVSAASPNSPLPPPAASVASFSQVSPQVSAPSPVSSMPARPIGTPDPVPIAPSPALGASAIQAASSEVPPAFSDPDRSILPFILGLLGILVASGFALYKFGFLKPQATLPPRGPAAELDTEKEAGEIRIVED